MRNSRRRRQNDFSRLTTSLLIVTFILFLPRSTSGQSQTTTINFDELPSGTLVINQYQPKVAFSATGFGAGSGGPYGFDLYADNYPPPWSTNRSLISDPNQGRGNPWWNHGFGDVYLDFSVPVNNLRFNILNFVYSGGSPVAYIDIYVNRFYHSTYTPYGSYNQGTIPVDLSYIQSITGIAIRYTRNHTPQGQTVALYYDNFTFNPYFDVKITNGRVNGYLNGTTQKALVGADVSLHATVLPSAETGGSFSWTFTGPHTVVGSPNSASVTIRPTNPGTITANVTYSRNTFTASGSVTINSILPALTSFTASQSPDFLTRGQNCSILTLLSPGVVYSSGCRTRGDPPAGMVWSATARIPPGPYLTDLTRSGIKFVQAISMYRKIQSKGNTLCTTRRSSQDNIQSGWGRDGNDPWGTGEPGDVQSRRFSEGETIPLSSFDPPAQLLERITQSVNISDDAFFGDDRFETYVFYFAGADPSNPILQRAIGFENSSFPVARLEWRWGGQVRFDPSVSLVKYRADFSNSSQGSIPVTGTNSVVNLSPGGSSLLEIPCPGTTSTSNPIDDTRVFVRYHYLDFLGREPDQGGWDFWRSQITQCIFDSTCIQNKRVDVSRAFFYSGEFINSVPALAESNRGTDSYNREFVRQCYYRYLQRTCNPEICDSGGFNFWVNKLNSQWPTMGDAAYNEMINAFILSIEYRNRSFQPM